MKLAPPEIPVARTQAPRLTNRVRANKSNAALAGMLILAVFLWGGSNVGTKYLVADWPPVWVGCTRLLCAGLVLLGILRWTRWLGGLTPISAQARRDLWWRGGLTLAVYIVVFNLALKYTSASHVALYLGTAPVWALVWEERPSLNRRSLQLYGAAALAVSGVIILNWPALRGRTDWRGELLGLFGSVLWTAYGRQSRALGVSLSGAEVGAHTMWRAGALLLPLAAVEVAFRGLAWRTNLVLVQGYCMLAGGVIAYALWNNALQHWPTSRVYLFNNLVPICTMSWAWVCLGEPVTRTFWMAMALIVLGVVLGQGRWPKVLGLRWLPLE
jgi:drug/metabolite transporter (DMT)-like permease